MIRNFAFRILIIEINVSCSKNLTLIKKNNISNVNILIFIINIVNKNVLVLIKVKIISIISRNFSVSY